VNGSGGGENMGVKNRISAKPHEKKIGGREGRKGGWEKKKKNAGKKRGGRPKNGESHPNVGKREPEWREGKKKGPVCAKTVGRWGCVSKGQSNTGTHLAEPGAWKDRGEGDQNGLGKRKKTAAGCRGGLGGGRVQSNNQSPLPSRQNRKKKTAGRNGQKRADHEWKKKPDR